MEQGCSLLGRNLRRQHVLKPLWHLFSAGRRKQGCVWREAEPARRSASAHHLAGRTKAGCWGPSGLRTGTVRYICPSKQEEDTHDVF
jgi:hypothetical protein